MLTGPIYDWVVIMAKWTVTTELYITEDMIRKVLSYERLDNTIFSDPNYAITQEDVQEAITTVLENGNVFSDILLLSELTTKFVETGG